MRRLRLGWIAEIHDVGVVVGGDEHRADLARPDLTVALVHDLQGEPGHCAPH
jgi:hypothetical protein